MAEFEYESKYDDLAYDLFLKFITETYQRIKHRSLILIHALEYHRDFLHKIWFNDFNTSLILSLIKISTLKIVQLLRFSQGNTQSIFYVIISNLLFLFPQ